MTKPKLSSPALNFRCYFVQENAWLFPEACGLCGQYRIVSSGNEALLWPFFIKLRPRPCAYVTSKVATLSDSA